MYMLWFNFILGLNFIFLSGMVFLSLKGGKIKFEPKEKIKPQHIPTHTLNTHFSLSIAFLKKNFAGIVT